MDKVEFRHGVGEGSILAIHCEQAQKGRTSVTYCVAVSNEREPSSPPIFTTKVTFVSVNDKGEKREI